MVIIVYNNSVTGIANLNSWKANNCKQLSLSLLSNIVLKVKMAAF